MIVAGTGHRPDKLGGHTENLRRDLVGFAENTLVTVRPDRVISGMALGWDQAIAQAAINLGIPYVAAVPFEKFDRVWPLAAQRRLDALLSAAAEVVVCSPYPGSVAMQRRNEWMVDNSDLLLALWDGSWGGTFNCIKYARRIGREVVNTWSDWDSFRMMRLLG